MKAPPSSSAAPPRPSLEPAIEPSRATAGAVVREPDLVDIAVSVGAALLFVFGTAVGIVASVGLLLVGVAAILEK